MRTEGSEREDEMDGFLIHAHFSFLGKCHQTISQYIVQESREWRDIEEEEEEEEEESNLPNPMAKEEEEEQEQETTD